MKDQENMLEILKIVAPGTVLREGLDNILKAKTGALIVVSDAESVIDEYYHYMPDSIKVSNEIELENKMLLKEYN